MAHQDHTTDPPPEAQSPEAALREARSLLDACPDAALLVHPTRAVAALNEAAARLLGDGGAPRDLVGRPLSDLLPSEVVEQVTHLVAGAAVWAEPARFEQELAGRWLDWRVVPVHTSEGNPPGLALFARDVTEARHEREALRYEVGFERLLADVSTSFAEESPDELEFRIADGPRTIGELVGVALAMLRQQGSGKNAPESAVFPPTAAVARGAGSEGVHNAYPQP